MSATDKYDTLARLKPPSWQQQELIASKIRHTSVLLPLKQNLFLVHGDKIAGASLIATSLLFWKVSFRGFNLARYGKGRITSLFLSSVMPVNGVVIYNTFTAPKILEPFSPESFWYHGFRSAAMHQASLFSTLSVGVMFNFLLAQRYKIIPVPDDFMSKGNRVVTYNFIKGILRPKAGQIIGLWLASTMIMFGTGAGSYIQSRQILAGLLNRQSIDGKQINN